MKKAISVVAGVLFYSICVTLCMGYGHTETHVPLNEVVVLKFLDKIATRDFADRERFKNYEFNWNNDKQPSLTGQAITGDFYVSYSAEDEVSRDYTPMEWIAEGGWMEDEPWGPASLCHFYDPLGIDGGRKYLTDQSSYIEWRFHEIKEYLSRDAKAWAISDPGHRYSWTFGKESVVKALKEGDPALREKHMAIAYRCLGHTMHLVADMGCTPHVRNDSHPPRFSFVIGDPDPYEDICKTLDVHALWQVNPPNTDLKTQFDASRRFDDIFEKLAVFTNDRFFSGQTIYTDKYKPMIRSDNPYPSPRMTEEDYDELQYAYYRNYDGVNVLMCKDKVPVPFPFEIITGEDSTRGQPYMDSECVESAAAALFPNIAQAGANVIRLFVPALRIDVTEARADSGGIVRGSIRYVTSPDGDEYFNLFDLENVYNGPVSLFVNGAMVDAHCGAIKGRFEARNVGTVVALEEDDLVKAQIEFGGIVLTSDPVAAVTGGVVPEPRFTVVYAGASVMATCTWTAEGKYLKDPYGPRPVLRDTTYSGSEEIEVSAGVSGTPITLSGTSFTGSKREVYTDGSVVVSSVSGSYDSGGSTGSASGTFSISGGILPNNYRVDSSCSFAAGGVPVNIDDGDHTLWFGANGVEACNYVTSISYHYVETPPPPMGVTEPGIKLTKNVSASFYCNVNSGVYIKLGRW